MPSNALSAIIIFIFLGIIGTILLLGASKEISEQNITSKSEPMDFIKKFRITVRTVAGLWFIISALIGLYMTITRLH